MAKNSIGFALSIVNKFAGSDIANKLHLTKPAEKLAYYSTRTGYQVLSSANQRIQKVKSLIFAPDAGTSKSRHLFDLRLTQEQQQIFDTLIHFSQNDVKPAAADADALKRLPGALLSAGLKLGLEKHALPLSYGGTGIVSQLTSVLMAEALAWGDMGCALRLLSNYSVIRLLNQYGSPVQQTAYLKLLANPQKHTATLAISEPTPFFDPTSLTTRVEQTKNGYKISGHKNCVPGHADLFLVAATLPDDSHGLFFVDRQLKGVTVSKDPAMGLNSAGLVQISMQDVTLDSWARLGDKSFNWPEVLDQSSLMWCAMAVGASQAVLDYMLPYCNQRQAFGEPISHRQAVAFSLADMATELEAMRLLTYRAASKAEQQLDYHRETYLARVQCNHHAIQIASKAIQLLGGQGYTDKHPVERFYRDLRAIALLHNGLHA
ncbi:MAG: acyl-CoA/acyl-ACP dehydrogenase [Pseudomonadales bacterium]|nr:acyl-CoA/acyl-ACP dehydrogenase [Pseudomonadales bacterium]